MSLFAWNYRGLGNLRNVRFLLEIRTQIKPNFVFLSETLTSKKTVEKICKQMHYPGCWVVESEGHSVALFWKNEGACVVTTTNKHFIDFEVENEYVGH